MHSVTSCANYEYSNSLKGLRMLSKLRTNRMFEYSSHPYSILIKYVTWTLWICLMCPHKPEGECGHINQIMTVHVTCVNWACDNQPCACNKLLCWFVRGRIKEKISTIYAINIKYTVWKIQYSGQQIQYSYFNLPCSKHPP